MKCPSVGASNPSAPAPPRKVWCLLKYGLEKQIPPASLSGDYEIPPREECLNSTLRYMLHTLPDDLITIRLSLRTLQLYKN